MKYTDGDYFGARCRSLETTWFGFDLDTRRRRFGFCFGGSFGRRGEDGLRGGPKFCLDIRAPMGEPHRLYLTGWLGLDTIIGLWPGNGSQGWSWRRSEATRRWHWIVIHPSNSRERWERAHPAEMAEREIRMKRRHVWMTYSNEDQPERLYWCPGHARLVRARQVHCSACGDLTPSDPRSSSGIMIAPWNDLQVEAMRDWQARPPPGHRPYACRGGIHDERSEEHPLLVPGRRGWSCPGDDCEYRQNWAFLIAY